LTATTLTQVDAETQFAELLERHRGIVFKVAATYCRNPADREDIAQEIVTQLWRAFPKFDATRTFSTWMYRIALNVAISFVRSNSVRERHMVALDAQLSRNRCDSRRHGNERRHEDQPPETTFRARDQRAVKERPMELDDLKQAVANLDRGVTQMRSLGVGEYKDRRLDRTRASLRPVLWERAGQVALGVVLAIAVGPFWWSRLTEPVMMGAGLVLHAYAILMIALGIRAIVAVRTLDLDAPVIEIQKALASLRRSYVVTGFVVGLPWWLLWIPLAMVVFGFDLVAGASRAWLVTNLIVGVVGIAATLWYYRHLWVEPADSERRRTLEKSAAGTGFRNAQRFLDEIARFERE
jgi:RNA polymerase sigma factor (sigma-70 family)